MRWLQNILEDPARLARAKRWFYLSLGVIAVAESLVPYLFPQDHAHFWFENLPAWGSLYGLVSCVLIIKVSKFLGKHWLMRSEDYYERPGRDERHEY